jgi:glycerophosphoryl diester phosphodiesterase
LATFIYFGFQYSKIQTPPTNFTMKNKKFQQIQSGNELEKLKNQVDGVQFTLQFSKDFQFFLFEETFLIFKNEKLIINNLNSSNIKKFKYENGESITKFDFEFLDKIEDSKLLVEIELKEFNDIFSYVIRLLNFLKFRPKLKERIIFSSLNPSILYFLKIQEPDMATMLLSRRYLVYDYFGKNNAFIPTTIADKPQFFQRFLRTLSFLVDNLFYYSTKTWGKYFLAVSAMSITDDELDFYQLDSFDFNVRSLSFEKVKNREISITQVKK